MYLEGKKSPSLYKSLHEIFSSAATLGRSRSWVVESAIMPADHESLISAKLWKVFVTVAQDRQNGALDKDKLLKSLKGWNRRGLFGTLQSIKMKSKWRWLKSQMERKILNFLKYEKHVTSEGKFLPSAIVPASTPLLTGPRPLCLPCVSAALSWLQGLLLGPLSSPHLTRPCNRSNCPPLPSWRCL